MSPGSDGVTTNALGQPVGRAVPDWRPPPRPERKVIEGRYCRLEPLDIGPHAAALFAANAEERDARSWTYLGYGPFASLADYEAWMAKTCLADDPLFFAILDKPALEPLGVASYLRIDPAHGSIEVGHLHYAPRLQRRPAATEAMFLLMDQAFALGYRRYEWKCHAMNAASRAAAERLGFAYEGLFRQAAVVKGRNRDTCWFSVIDREWPALREAFETWLAPENFDSAGRQRTRLSDLTRALRGF